MADILATPINLGFSKKISPMCKNVLTSAKNCKKKTFLLILPLESCYETNRITTNLVKMIFFYCQGFFQKKTVELKFITSASPYRLDNLETRISGFAENSILAALEHLSERNSVEILPQFGSCYV